MKKYFLTAFLVCLSSITISQEDTNAITKLRNVKELFEMGLISQSDFDSISKNLTQIILNQNITSSSKKTEEKIEEEGFFFDNKKIIPERFVDTQTDLLGTALTGGILGGGIRSYLIGQNSPNKVKFESDGQPANLKRRELKKFETVELDQVSIDNNVYIKDDLDFGNVTFTLKIGPSKLATGIADQFFFSVVQSPIDFALVKLKKPFNTSRGGRFLQTGSMSLVDGYRMTVKPNLMIPFEWKEVSPNTFEISARLNRGEYAFVFVGTVAYVNNSLFTFSLE